MKKRLILSVIVLILGVLTYFGVGIFKDLQNLANTINPNRLTTFNYDEKPVMITVGRNGRVQYKVPKAYLNSKVFPGLDGKIYQFNIWASIKDDMAPWPLSKAFKERDGSSVVSITVRGNSDNNNIRDSSYKKIEEEKKWGGGVNRGNYKNLFTRYDAIRRTIIKKGKRSIKWHEQYQAKKHPNYEDQAKFFKRADGNIVEKSLGSFYLIPKDGNDKYFFIRCVANSPNANCRVRSFYATKETNIWYEFLIPIRIVEKYLDYDKNVKKLIGRLIYHPTDGEK